MAQSLSNAVLRKQNQIFKGTGGVSEKNRSQGFIPAFYDSKSHQARISRFANGTPAPVHILDGLPEEWIVECDPSGRVMAVKASVIAGFIYHGRFYTREQAAWAVRGESCGKRTFRQRPLT
jgi:hypothetical protein